MGCFKKALKTVERFAQPVADVALAATGNAEFIPLANAAITGTEDLASGKSFGQSLKGAAISGFESLAAQEAAGALGIGGGNTAVNSALGIDISPAATGLPDIGGGISSLFGSGGASTDASGITNPSSPASTATGGSIAPGASASGASTTAASGGGFSTPSNLASLNTQGLDALDSSLGGDVNSAIGATSQSPGLGTIASNPLAGDLAAETAAGGATGSGTTNLVNSFAAQQAAAAPKSLLEKLTPSTDTLAKAAIPLGFAGYEALKGAPAPTTAEKALQPSGAVTAPLIATENQQLNEANTGKLSPGEQASVLQFVNDNQNSLIQQLASQGVTDVQHDSRYIEGMQQIKEKALQIQQQYITSALQAGLSAAGQAAPALTTAASQQNQSDQSFQTALEQAFSVLGSVAGGGGVNINVGGRA